MPFVTGGHHLTMCVHGAQEDVDFHVKTLGMRLIKRTVLFDGTIPVYHLYYSNADGDPGAILTTFPFGQAGIKGRPGTNQSRDILLSVPEDSLDFWRERLEGERIATETFERFGKQRLAFAHPCGIKYQMVAVSGDTRRGNAGAGVPQEYAIHGNYGIGVEVYDPDTMLEFVREYFSDADVVQDGERFAVDIGTPGAGAAVELHVNRTEDQGTWIYGDGTIHHFAMDVGNYQNQDELKFIIEGAGYTAISELKDRKYFKSVYVRTPGGALFELAVTTEQGWTIDESPKELGKNFQLPEQFESRRNEIFSKLERIEA